MREFLERVGTRNAETRVVGELRLPAGVLDAFRQAPYDMLPDFQPPPGREGKPARGRGKDHPRYGRFTYALAKVLQPDYITEVGTYAGGSTVGWATALREANKGTLICVDNDSYSKGTYPEVARRNILATGLPEDRLQLRNGLSNEILAELVGKLKGKVDIYLVDADHTFEGACADLENGFPLVKPGGYILVHDVDRSRKMAEETADHPHPVYEAFMEFVGKHSLSWCILTFIRKHLGVIQVPAS